MNVTFIMIRRVKVKTNVERNNNISRNNTLSQLMCIIGARLGKGSLHNFEMNATQQ